ncbi:MAG: hypothetical protein PHY93_04205 [Bacteriovorax sp.]|nr:hypothetical protein [Bacteriovorax sp.]
MIKKFFIILLVLLLGAAAFLYFEYSAKKTLIIPYPYSFNANAKMALEKEIVEAGNAKILIVGDRLGEALSKYTPELIDELAKSFKYPPKIYNWSKPHEGLHRTLNKLKSLKKFPSIIIYHGASSELFEKTFEVADKEAIFKNFSLYDDEKIISLIITFPGLSKIIYKKMQYLELGPVKEYQNRLPSTSKILEKEVSFKLFDYELRELIDLVKDKKSNLILITTPLNLEVRPHEICSHSTTNGVIEMQQEIEELLKEGNFKKAYPMALALSNETFSNALSFYLLGQASMGLGDLAMARESFQKATVFDCTHWRGNAVYNSIMKSTAKKRQVTLIDFDQYMASALSRDGLFMDDIFPQNVFYQTMIAELKESLKKILSVD